MKSYEYRHVVGFEETNLVGNVYYVNHLRWQGRCREFFLRDHAPGILEELKNGLKLVTVRCSCEYFEELEPFDQIVLRMTLDTLKPSGVVLGFSYFKIVGGTERRVARGEQEIACLRGETLVALPAELHQALRPFKAP